ncbi:cytochrome c [Niallia sp. XMNu-256]|uniref:cytochrome c550 n=1 Tax=Niallia sp. XMNu-256 TaxID=3082444 RepID=UPI0030D52F3E
MKKGPLLPFGIIMVLGVLTMLLLSFKGIGDSRELAAQSEGDGEQTEQVAASPEEIYQSSCIGCHGDQYQGSGSAPGLTGVGERLSPEEIEDVVVNGRNAMPGGLVPPEQAGEMAEWLSGL